MPSKSSYQPGEPIWIDLSTPDMDKTVAFYTGLFGWTYGGGSPEHGGYGSFFSDGKQVCGVAPLMAPGMPAVWSTYIATDDADKSAALVTEHGGTVLAPPMDVGDLGRLAFFSDPTGAALGVWQPGTMTGAEIVGEEGTYIWTELSTRDQGVSQPFYRAVFNWEPQTSPEYSEFQLAGTSVAGCMDMPAEVPAEVPSYWMPYFAASDPAAQATKAGELGAEVVVPFMDFGEGQFSLVRDPHGSMFGLLHMG